MAWSSKVQLFSSASVEDTELFSSGFKTISERARSHVSVKVTFGGTTDDLVVSVYSNPDPITTAASATVGAGGSGYVEGDILTVSGGTTATAATFRVTGETGGAVDTVEVVEPGDYSVTPANPASTTGGTGTGCTLNVTWNGDEWDTENVATRTIPSSAAATFYASLLVKDYQRMRVGVVGGSTDTHTVVVSVSQYDPAL